jgi:hypothetical protein
LCDAIFTLEAKQPHPRTQRTVTENAKQKAAAKKEKAALAKKEKELWGKDGVKTKSTLGEAAPSPTYAYTGAEGEGEGEGDTEALAAGGPKAPGTPPSDEVQPTPAAVATPIRTYSEAEDHGSAAATNGAVLDIDAQAAADDDLFKKLDAMPDADVAEDAVVAADEGDGGAGAGVESDDAVNDEGTDEAPTAPAAEVDADEVASARDGDGTERTDAAETVVEADADVRFYIVFGQMFYGRCFNWIIHMHALVLKPSMRAIR